MLVLSVQVLGDYVFSEWRERNLVEKRSCKDCRNEEECKSNCLNQTEFLVGKVIDFRKRDEMVETKKAIVKAIASAKKKGSDDTMDVLKELYEESKKCRERMQVSFPKILLQLFLSLYNIRYIWKFRQARA